MLGIAAAGVYALYMTLSSKLVRNIPPLHAAAFMLLGATTTIGSLTILRQGLAAPASLPELIPLLGLAIISTALPIACLFAGLKRLGVVPAAILSTLEPVLAVVLSIWLLGEQFWGGQLLGGALILSSALMLQAKSGGREK